MMERSDSAKPDVEVYEVAEDWDSHECARHLKPFFISEESNPLVRIVVIGKPSGAYLLIHCAHIIYDGASLQLFLDDLIAALQGKALQPEPVTLFDVSLQEAAYAGTAQGVRDQEYYGQLCSGCTAITELQPGKDLSGSVGFSYDTGLVDAYCRSKAVTASSFWTTTMLRALHRVTGIDDLAVCTFSSRRSAAEWRRTSGMLLRLLPIVSHSRDQETGRSHARAPGPTDCHPATRTIPILQDTVHAEPALQFLVHLSRRPGAIALSGRLARGECGSATR